MLFYDGPQEGEGVGFLAGQENHAHKEVISRGVPMPMDGILRKTVRRGRKCKNKSTLSFNKNRISVDYGFLSAFILKF